MDKQYHIKLNGKLIPVSEEVYRAYQRPKWREKKQAEVRKEMECSYDHMVENGYEQTDPNQSSLDEIFQDKLLLDELLSAIASLNDDERTLIYALFYKGKSERELSKVIGVPRPTIYSRKKSVLKKLRNMLR